MRTRQIEMLHIMVNNKVVDISTIMGIYDISKRTLFYDLEEINYELSGLGKLRINQDVLILEGDVEAINTTLAQRVFEPYYDRIERQDRILYSILEEEHKTLDDYLTAFSVSKTTVFADIEAIRSRLYQDGLSLDYNKHYLVTGPEYKIRDVYLSMLNVMDFQYQDILDSVIQFNERNQLVLSDYSMFYLSKFIKFIDKRRKHQSVSIYQMLNLNQSFIETVDIDVREILNIENDQEADYLKAYILSLYSCGHQDVSNIVHLYVSELLKEIKIRMALNVTWNDSFKASLENHLIASFYRIKFGFPALNQSLNDIRVKYFYMFMIVKNTIRSIDHISIFHKMRDEEIGFVVAYIGGYLYDKREEPTMQHRVILVCPQGRAVAHHLRNQIEKGFSSIDVIDVLSINQLGNIVEHYDAIITTLDLPQFQNVIKVNPILSESDCDRLFTEFGSEKKETKHLEIQVMKIIEKYTTVHNRPQLIQALSDVLETKNEGRSGQPMLNEVINRDRIQIIDSISDWKVAIQFASKPLLNEGVFTQDYVDAMISAVEQYGPYIVLADEFALPHASNQGNVKEVAISLLKVNEPVDLKGNPVKIFMVLATVDNHTHLKALAGLTEIISVDEKLQQIKDGDIETILRVLKEGGDL
ncbi:hypothetical protein AOC36_08180 [Erysipelothrix larvae]|uniref:Ascorbate-specific PTS system EIIA component n=1 Tax=Erysipelothrix larvae TaxID=1514105 RepID=A0A120JTU2_9FIRM|nr:PTS sugar transporter subunit IIA [Erysipelothrix larvae]AMC93963.1 hypothetical protein AOC36_08180 [Erysipelothrix larvae]